MTFNGKSIENWFCSQRDEPEYKDYVINYNSIKKKLAPIHDEVKSVVAKIDPSIFLNAHGVSHIKMVIEKATMLLSNEGVILTAYEMYFLLLAIQFHDIGHIINGRNTHAIDSNRIISKIDDSLLGIVEKKAIFQIASAHSGKENPIGQLPLENTISNERIRFRLISALVRLADELADGTERASSFLLENDLIPPKSEIYHIFSSCLDSCVPQFDYHAIDMKFYLNEKRAIKKFKKKDTEIYLVDEIYIRTMNTFTECLYYNRFVPESLRINSVHVEINFLNTETLMNFHETIKYKIEEQGYPLLHSDSIFEICKKDLQRGDDKIDGEYIFNKLEQSSYATKQPI